jgi:cytoskeletal protein RodZ
MRNKRMKRLVVAGGIIAMVFLIVLIGRRFQKDPTTEATIPTDKSESSEVVVKNPDNLKAAEKEVKVTVAPIATEAPNKESSSVDKGTEQKIQSDVTPKPTYTKEQLTDPTKKPNGEKVEIPKTKDKKATPTPTPTPTPKPDKKTDKQTDNKSEDNNSSGGLPGFDNVPDGGANQVIDGDSDGDIDKQIGNMD